MRNKIDETKIAEAFTVLCELHERQMPPVVSKLYIEVLKEFSAEQITMAISRSIRELKWFPKPAELIEFIQGPTPQIKDVAEIQAAEVIRQISPVGYYGCPVFSDPVTDRLFQGRFRWQSVCSLAESDLKWFVREFKEAYRAHKVLDESPRLEAPVELKQLTENIGRVIN